MEIHEIGEVIRKIRKERGLRLEDLADENISPATISNIERGVPHVNPEKTQYLLQKLDLEMDKLPSLVMNEQRELENVRFELFALETMRDIDKPDEALKGLEELDLDDSHPYAALYYYVMGKCYNSKKDWKRAERSLFNAVRLANQHPINEKSNIEAAAFTELGLCSYYQNNLEQALKYTESGIAAFVEDGERKHFIDVLLRNKGIYLERLGRLGEAMQIVQEAWRRLPHIEQLDVVLGLYWLRSEILRRTGLFDEAIHYAMEGLELGRFNWKYDSLLDLWTVLGSTYMGKKDWERAIRSFDMALKFKNIIPSDLKFPTVYTQLGILYMHQKRWEDAKTSLETAIKIAKNCSDTFRLTHALYITGDFYRITNQHQEAISFYKEALSLAKKHHYTKKEYQALFRLAQCWENIDKEEFHRTLQNMYLVQQQLQRKEEIPYEEVV
ncbi:hypothetical protein GCM10011571_06940 [Marinithermofilum abyssi]|uniref:HTH cro/C1-type domain-containing protein n=1 Tax=Marinithermofilum abyssi TaxID=1571185 RepID=A0A8J2VGB9_9BACL|nr:hypothetical protein GCM10011571_06940 [Marinithermofilum abyssi]